MISATGIALIKQFEGCKLNAYLDGGGVPTIGWGTTGPNIKLGMKWTQDQADAALYARIAEFERGVMATCTELPNTHQLDAMVCLAYNIGLGAFKKSTVLRMHNARKFAEAGAAFGMWNKDGGVVRAGLTRRRAAEAALYLTPVEPTVEQTTRAVPDASKDPATAKVSPTAIAAGIGGGLTVAQQAVAQVQQIWDGLHDLGISPHILMSALGVAGVVTLGWFLYSEWKRRKEGDR